MKGLVKSIREKDFEFSSIGFKKKVTGSVLELENSKKEIIEVSLPSYHAGIADRKFLIGSEVDYSHKNNSYGYDWTDTVYSESYILKILTGGLKGEKFETNVSY